MTTVNVKPSFGAPAGWVAARGAPPLAVEVGVDLRPVQAALAPCFGDDLTHEPIGAGVFGGRGFAYQLDVDDREVRAAFAGRVDPRVVAEAVDEIPGLGSRRWRRIRHHAVTEVDLPMIPTVAFTQAGEDLIGAVGLAIDPILTGATDPGTERVPAELGRFEVRPLAWTAAQWDALLDDVITHDRAIPRPALSPYRPRHGAPAAREHPGQ